MESKNLDPSIYKTSAFVGEEELSSGVSWGAVFAGATAAAVLTVLLLILGFGLGLSIAPWSYEHSTLTMSTFIWIIATELVASAVGGYLAGRLRAKQEAAFQDTSHGLLSWAVAFLLVVMVLFSITRIALIGLGGVVSGVSNMTAGISIGAAAAMSPILTFVEGDNSHDKSIEYFTDMLLRTEHPSTDSNDAALQKEVTKILVTSVYYGELTSADREYLVRVIARRTNLSQAEVEQRINDIYSKASRALSDAQAKAKQAADKARQTTARSALWLFVALIVGAFIASLVARLGGYQRDRNALAQS